MGERFGKAEIIIYKGIRFRRYPDAKTWADRSYYVPNMAERKRGIGRLHQEIWKDANGPIPAGYEIHHKDHNPLNNDLSNLELISAVDHHAHHDAGYTAEELRRKRQQAEHARKAARQWHTSEEARAWHSEMGKMSAAARYPVKRTCEYCGQEFETDNITALRSRIAARYCSNNCKSAARYHSGVDDEQRICLHCGQAFTVNRYLRVRFCSRSCGRRYHLQRKNE